MAVRKARRPPKQKPVVNSASTRNSSCARRWSTAARMSAGRPAQVDLLDVRHVLELVAAPGDARRPAEVVDRERVDAVLGEPQRELLVVGMQAADVGEDQDPGAGHLGRARPERPEPVAVLRLEHQLGRIERAAGDRDDRGTGIEIEAHAASTSAAKATAAAGRSPLGHRSGPSGGRRSGR